MSKECFSESTQAVLAAANIAPYEALTSIDAQELADSGVAFCVTDLDGVLREYNQELEQTCLQRLCEINEALPKGAVVVTNNPRGLVDGLPDSISVRICKTTRPWDFKPFPFAIKDELRKRDVRGADVAGFCDGLSDVVAYKLAGIGKVGLVSSLGAHRAQEFVHRNIYRHVSPLAAAAIRFAKTF